MVEKKRGPAGKKNTDAGAPAPAVRKTLSSIAALGLSRRASTPAKIYYGTLAGVPVESIPRATSDDCAVQQRIVANAVVHAMYPHLFDQGDDTPIDQIFGNADGCGHAEDLLNGPYLHWVAQHYRNQACTMTPFSYQELSTLTTIGELCDKLEAHISCTNCQ